MPLKESLYDITENQRNDIKHKGFNYKGRLFEKTMSPLILKEEKRAAILEKMEDVMYHLIESVKDIKLHFSYSRKKGSRDFN